MSVSQQITKLGHLKKYLEYLEDYYTNIAKDDSTSGSESEDYGDAESGSEPSGKNKKDNNIRTEVDNAIRQMEQAIGAINSKFDYSEMILDKLHKAIKEFGFNSIIYRYGDCSGIYDIVIDKGNRKITGELFVPLSSGYYWYEYTCILENDDIDGPLHADYRINVIITPYEDNPKNVWYVASDNWYQCSPFTAFDELINTTCEDYIMY